MNLGVLSLGAVNPYMAACGADPCGVIDYLSAGVGMDASAECEAYLACASNQYRGANPQDCVVGGVDAFGDTIINCSSPIYAMESMPCLTGQGPLQPGQVRCSDIYTTMAGIPADSSAAQAGGSGKVIMLAGAALLLFALVKR